MNTLLCSFNTALTLSILQSGSMTGSSLKSILKNAERLDIISRERIVDEFHKVLLSEVPSVGFLLLHKTKLFHFLLLSYKTNDIQGLIQIIFSKRF